MAEYAIDFESFKWEEVTPGKGQKLFTVGKNRIRILELSNGYKEANWCDKRHIGYVIEGQVTIVFEDKDITLDKGEGLYISGGEKSRHKAQVADGQTVQLLLFEEA